MSEFEYHNAGNGEAQQRMALSWLFEQSSTGKAATGVLSGLAVTQTTTASSSVLVGAGAGIAQAAVLDGASLLGSDTQATLDVLTANPVGGLPRFDLVVFDVATLSPVAGGTASGGLRVIVGVPSASPTDPAVPSSAIRLARLRHAAGATTVPASAIDDLRTFTRIQSRTDVVLSSTGKAGARQHWGTIASGNTDSNGYRTITHGAGFTPTAVMVTLSVAWQHAVDQITSTTFRVRILAADGTVSGTQSIAGSFWVGE